MISRFRSDDFQSVGTAISSHRNIQYTFNDVISFLKKGEYISDSCNILKVYLIGILNNEYVIPFSDEIMDVRLVDFKDNIQKYYLNDLKDNEFIYYEILEIC